MEQKVFLGGTCSTSVWREELIPLLKIPYFNPVVEDWTPAMQQIELEERNTLCNIHLYVITKEIEGYYSIAEVMDSVYLPGKTTILQIIPEGFNEVQLKSLKAVVNLVNLRGGNALIDENLHRCADLINAMNSED